MIIKRLRDGGRVGGEELLNSRDDLEVELVGFDVLDVTDSGQERLMGYFQSLVSKIYLCALYWINCGW